jgi:hypothetical protein
VNAGTLFYLYLARVSVPVSGTGFTERPEVSGVRSVAHVVLFDQLNGDDRALSPRASPRLRLPPALATW